MKNKTTLKMYRRKTPLLQQDIAHLIDMDYGQYNRIEKGNRPPSLDVISIFHLFGVGVHQLFPFDFENLRSTIITQSRTLIEQLKSESSLKSKNRLVYIERFVKFLINKEYEQEQK